MWLFLVLLQTWSMNPQEKEDFCYTLSMRSTRERSSEIQAYIASIKIISEPALKSKLIEDAFTMCLSQSDLDAIPGDLSVYKSYKSYEKYVKVPLAKYKNLQDLKISLAFSEKKPEIARRSIMNPRIFAEDL
jgi:hypothetical protein